jgi:RimJ/RimL family protein N-acetyltransferase
MDAHTPVKLRRASVEDIPFMMATERQPGFEWFVGQWSAELHAERMADPTNAYLVGLDHTGQPQGFVIVRHLDEPEGNIYLQRIAIAVHGTGFGRRLLLAVTDFVFRETGAFRFWLHMKADNARADYVYRSLGFTEEGRLRLAHIGPNGERGDALIFSMLRPEWSSRSASATT